MKKLDALATSAALGAMVFSANASAQSANAGAGAKIIAPLQIAKTTDLYFGTIAPSLASAGVVAVAANGSRDCGVQLTCLIADHTAAAFSVTGEMDETYTISLPGTIQIANGAGDQMDVYDFVGSKSGGITAAQLAVDCKIKQSLVPQSTF